MPLSRVKIWVAGEVLAAADLNNEFNNILNNGQLLVQPWVGSFDLDGNTLILDQDADTTIDAATDDTIDIMLSGADDFRFTANQFTALSGSNVTIQSGNFEVTAGNVTVGDGDVTISNADSRTTTTATPLTIAADTSGSPAGGIGTGILFKAESQDESASLVGQLEFYFTDVATGSEDSACRMRTRVAGGASLSSTYVFTATTTNQAAITHANTINQTYALPDAGGTIMLTDTVLDVAPSTPTANVLYRESGCKGFVKFQVNGTIDTDLNVSSITDNGAGDWTVNWARAFSSGDYAVVATTQGAAGIDATNIGLGCRISSINPPTASAVRIWHAQYVDDAATGAPLTDPSGTTVRIHVVAFGVQ